ncbi:hypothetical protein QJS10_CPB11g01231 [Acorus calamus]|uniref:DUF4283 domain-containing protein n=1 Tax=Acorus calamus TaxID=4465 RepID=A0AAV9DQK3_ACOCL|nr:hypothetical protein QJS10_CPB11g01231 [Acorus calamus]
MSPSKTGPSSSEPPDPSSSSPPKVSKPPPPRPREGFIDSVLLSLTGNNPSPSMVTSLPAVSTTSDGEALAVGEVSGITVVHPVDTICAVVGAPVQSCTELLSVMVAPSEKGKGPVREGPSKPANKDLEFIEPVLENGELVVPSEDSDLLEMDSHWQYSLVGYVIGKKPFYKPFIDFLYHVWKPKGNLEILIRGGGFFVARFSNQEDMQRVMEGGPWLIGGRPIVLRKWSRGMNMETERLETIPIWISLPQLPLHLWGKRKLSNTR